MQLSDSSKYIFLVVISFANVIFMYKFGVLLWGEIKMELYRLIRKITYSSSFIEKIKKFFRGTEPILDFNEMVDQEKMSLFER